MGEVYGLPRHVFDEARLDEWAERRGALVKSIEDAALGMASVYRGVGLPLPRQMSMAGEKVLRRFQELLESRGIVEKGRLTRYGRAVEAMPTERPWAELLVNADDELVPFLAVMCSVESLHRMTREERDLDGVIVPGSDHLTAYNLYAEAYAYAGSMGEVYGLPRHVFDEARVSKTSVCGSWGAVAGDLRYFADKFGNPRASIEGTQVPADLIRRYAHTGESELFYDPERKHAALTLRRRVTYYGFELEREIEVIDQFPPELAGQARHALAEALARGEARHPGVHRNRDAVEEVRETYRRSGGATPRLGMAELTALYEQQLAGVNSMSDFRHARVNFDADAIVPREVRERYADLPGTVEVRGKDVEIQYDVEENEGVPFGVARLRLPEKIARNLSEAELPTLDRPLRFVVTRGMRGAARAATLEELQDELDRPFTREEIEGFERVKNRQRDERRHGGRNERRGREEDERFVRDDRKVPNERSDGRRRKPGLRAKRRGRH
jgi:hypothetical protein